MFYVESSNNFVKDSIPSLPTCLKAESKAVLIFWAVCKEKSFPLKNSAIVSWTGLKESLPRRSQSF
jgi:hypothetical protein